MVSQENLNVEGNAMVLFQQARKDTKRYAKLFKMHVEQNNSHYKVGFIPHCIFIRHETAGTNTTILTYPYKAGYVKALYLLLVCQKYNMDDFLKSIKNNGFTPFPDNEYVLRDDTPEPQEDLQRYFTKIEGKWH